MTTSWKWAWLGIAATIVSGCTATGPLIENPAIVRPDPDCATDNPVFVPLGPESYGKVFEQTLDILDDYFEIAYANRYDGRIETFPRVAPGFEQFWKVGNPDCRERLLATFQTIRNRAIVLIQPAEDGGYFVQVTVFKELEDLPQPLRAAAGGASFAQPITVERQYEVIDPAVFETKWIPQGRNCPLEQLILQRLKKCM